MTTMIAVGIDTGQVHSAVTRVLFDAGAEKIYRKYAVFNGLDTAGMYAWVVGQTFRHDYLFVEKYRPRHNYGPDTQMVKAEGELKRLMPDAVLLENSGIRKVCPPRLMEVLGLWNWPQSTHHQDLRSAARIMIKGLLRDPEGNAMIADIVRAHLNTNDWEVVDV